ncbi:MAG: ABC transporter permease [Lachnospiraceae bacterium]|nr:ABC transporter permease [Lachnospiraceae bacterium]
MKKTQLLDAVRNIRKKLVSFLSLILIVLLGIAGFYATDHMARDLRATTERFYQERNFKDIIMISSLGVGEEEVSRIAAAEGVADAEGVTVLSGIAGKGEISRNVTVLSSTERVSKPVLLEGSLPTGEDSCVLGTDAMKALSVSVGDTIQLNVNDPSLPDCLKKKEFKVVGVVNQPEYLREIHTDFVMVHRDAFDPDATMDSYTRVFVKAELPQGMSVLSQEYLNFIAELVPRLDAMTESLGKYRVDSIKNRFLDKLEFLQDDTYRELKDLLYGLSFDELLSELTDNPEKLVEDIRDISLKAQMVSEHGFSDLLKKLPKNVQDWLTEQTSLPLAVLGSFGDSMIQKIGEQGEKGAAMLEKVVRGAQWIVLDNRSDIGYLDIRSSIQSCERLSLVYGLLFGLVSMLVCFSTLTIIINEQKKMIGATKAFGFKQGEVLGKYMIFGEAATLIGAIGGIILGNVLCRLVVDSYIKAYTMGGIIQDRPLWFPIAVTAGYLLLSAVAVFIACRSVLKSSASSLVNGTDTLAKKHKKKGSESGGSLYSRLIIRNILSELPRVIISIVIIAGSCVIIGVGFTLRFSIEKMKALQLSDVSLYDVRISYNASDTESAAKVRESLTAAGADVLDASYETHIFETEKGQEALILVTAQDDNLNRFIGMKDSRGNALSLPKDGVLAQIRMSEVYKLDPGDTLQLRDNSLGRHEAVIRGVFNNYQGRMMLTSCEAYEKIFGQACEMNTFFVLWNGVSEEKQTELLQQLPQEMSAERSDSFLARYEVFTKLYDAIVIGMLIMSILLTFLILSNLTNIFVSRKKRELIIMRVNGFSLKEGIGYLTRETILTTVLGLVIGVIAGIFLARMVIAMLEQPDVQFVRTPIPLAWVLAVLFESLFAGCIDFMAFRKVAGYNLNEIAN